MNTIVLRPTDRRAPRARDADTLERFFHADWEDIAKTEPQWGDFESPLQEEAFWREHA